MRYLLIAPLLLAGLLFACGYGGEDVETADFVSEVPWPDEERTEYVILDGEDGDPLQDGVLTATRNGDEFELELHFENDEGQTDDSLVVVDAETLKPVSVRREQRVDGVDIIEGVYDPVEEVLDVVEIDEDGDERLVPLRLDENYYDNESSLFLWRTIPFAIDYEVNYNTVLATNRTQHPVNVLVVEKEQITVPAGTFDTWKVEIRATGRLQTVWISDTPQRLLVQYDNSRNQFFQLTNVSPDPSASSDS